MKSCRYPHNFYLHITFYFLWTFFSTQCVRNYSNYARRVGGTNRIGKNILELSGSTWCFKKVSNPCWGVQLSITRYIWSVIAADRQFLCCVKITIPMSSGIPLWKPCNHIILKNSAEFVSFFLRLYWVTEWQSSQCLNLELAQWLLLCCI